MRGPRGWVSHRHCTLRWSSPECRDNRASLCLCDGRSFVTLLTISQDSNVTSPPRSLASTDLLSISMEWLILAISEEWDRMTRDLFRLASVT